MNGREKFEAAFSAEGSPEIPAVICYDRLFIRDHWKQLFDHPWWYWYSPDVDEQFNWRRDAVRQIGQDWVRLENCMSKEKRNNRTIVHHSGGTFMLDKSTGKERQLHFRGDVPWKQQYY